MNDRNQKSPSIREPAQVTQIGFWLPMALVVALLIGSTERAAAAPVRTSSLQTKADVETLALKWFANMQNGQIDRTRLSSEYNAQLTDAAVRKMSQYLKQHDYGTPPTRAEVMQERMDGAQTFYEVKLIFPRGDAASLLFGFDAAGKVTGVSLLSMAGD